MRSNSATDVCTMRLIAIGPRLSLQTAIVPGGPRKQWRMGCRWSPDVGDIRRLVAEGVNGFVVTRDQQAEHSMTSALTRLLTDPGLRSRMSAAARSRAQSEFSLSQLADQVLIAYDKAGWKQKLTGSKADLLLNSPA